MNNAQAVNVGTMVGLISHSSDEELEQVLKELDRLDFDRLRRKANWLTHRREGK